MTIYIDYIFFINFLFDLILLFSLSIILKRNVKTKKIFIGALSGALSGYIVLLNISQSLFFLLKISLGIIMLIITFNYKDIKYTLENTFYLMILSIILGGLLYLINLNMKLNILFLIIISIIFLRLYIKINNKTKPLLQNKYKVNIKYKNKIYKLNGYLDTGNLLKDPYFNKPISIVNKNIFKIDKYLLVPCRTITNTSIIKCFKVDMDIKGLGMFKDTLIGITDKINIEGVDIIINNYLKENI